MGSSSNLRRAHSMNEFLQIMERFLSKESLENCYSFKPSSTKKSIPNETLSERINSSPNP